MICSAFFFLQLSESVILFTMLLTSQRLFADSPSILSFSNLYFARSSTPSLSITLRQHLSNPAHLRILKLTSLKPENFNSFRTSADLFRLRAYESDGAVQKDVVGDFNLDSLLSLAELLCLLSSAILFVGFAVSNVMASSKKEFLVAIGSKVVLWGVLMLVGGVVMGAWIRRRQWRRICRETRKEGLQVNLLERIEKLEEDLKSSVTVVRVLSRQLEKLGIRFRVTRKGLKEPIAETAALAQKNSEATRALVARSDILEKELGEIQKVLLAMQEQQQKQLDLILAIGKTSKLWEGKRVTREVQNTSEASKSDVDEVNKKEFHQI
ncbi:uncharacterized protein LOC114714592 [Neltuma alba]|uniref:uncharacterized protein LOC114714592 n=1 Tax=Neltuma alba TaxID=207710 RepID=UPI0010A59DFE|nr:uncharacterized protein LOC114714592 [Prosopis alba]